MVYVLIHKKVTSHNSVNLEETKYRSKTSIVIDTINIWIDLLTFAHEIKYV